MPVLVEQLPVFILDLRLYVHISKNQRNEGQIGLPSNMSEKYVHAVIVKISCYFYMVAIV